MITLNDLLTHIRQYFDGIAFGAIALAYLLITGGILAFIHSSTVTGVVLLVAATIVITLVMTSVEYGRPYCLYEEEARNAAFAITAIALAVFTLFVLIRIIGWVDLAVFITLLLVGGLLWHPIRERIHQDRQTAARRADSYPNYGPGGTR
jgi:membrane protein implicated in regulation of membrane protease activity